jgi:hypothetical protein
MHTRLLISCALAATLSVAAAAAAVARDLTPDEWWQTRGASIPDKAHSASDDWWSAMDASLPPDVAVKKAVKARKGAPPPDTKSPPPEWQPPRPPPPIPQWTGEFGGRYWLGFGRDEFDLYDTTGSVLHSRLTYTGLQSHAGEGFGRVVHLSGFFIKGFGGAEQSPAAICKMRISFPLSSVAIPAPTANNVTAGLGMQPLTRAGRGEATQANWDFLPAIPISTSS